MDHVSAIHTRLPGIYPSSRVPGPENGKPCGYGRAWVPELSVTRRAAVLAATQPEGRSSNGNPLVTIWYNGKASVFSAATVVEHVPRYSSIRGITGVRLFVSPFLSGLNIQVRSLRTRLVVFVSGT